MGPAPVAAVIRVRRNMFPQFKNLNNESGVILFIVLMTSIVIMLYSVGILTQSVNEIYYAQQQIDQITAGQLSSGVFWNSYASGMTNVSTATTSAGTSAGTAYEET